MSFYQYEITKHADRVSWRAGTVDGTQHLNLRGSTLTVSEGYQTDAGRWVGKEAWIDLSPIQLRRLARHLLNRAEELDSLAHTHTHAYSDEP
jgi:hypothetical protein